MSNTEITRAGGVPGRFSVDHECICCSVCSDLAPEHFREGDEQIGNVVYRQPDTDAELAACREALDSCPVEAIHDR